MTGSLERLRVLIVEDSEDDALLVSRELGRSGFTCEMRRVITEAAMAEALGTATWDVILADFSVPGFGAEAALRLWREAGSEVPVVVVSGSIGEEGAASLMRAGARDVLRKGRLSTLGPVIRRELEEAASHRAKHEVEESLRQSERRFQQVQKLEAVGRLAGGIAHDFNNILTVILGQLELCQEKVAQSPELVRPMRIVREAGERAAALTRQLLTFSRQSILAPRQLDLRTTVRDMEDFLRRLIGEDIVLRMAMGGGVGRVFMDPGQVGQVVMNLAVNARDAMPKGGTLTVSVDEVAVGESPAGAVVPPGPYVRLAIVDSGEGMEEGVRLRIFEPFFTTKEAGRGTGLGLSTVYGIVKASGGGIAVESAPGRGTRFEIFLPLQAEHPKSQDADPATAKGIGGTETILLAEDDEPVRYLTSTILQQYGYRVLEATDGEDALRIATAHAGPIHLLVSDMVMPGLGGRELAARLGEVFPGLPVLFISGYAESVLGESLDALPGPMLEKPFSRDALARRVRGLLDRP